MTILDFDKPTKKQLNIKINDIYSSPEDITKMNNEEKIKAIINLLIKRESSVLDVKGKPTEIFLPIIMEQLIVEINYLFDDSKIVSEEELNTWIDQQQNKFLSYNYKKYLISWKILTNDIKIFTPIGSDININVKPIIRFDKDIPDTLAKAIMFEEKNY